MSGPTLPINAERKLDAAPIAAKLRRGGRGGRERVCRQTTIRIRKAPNKRVSAASGARAKRSPPASASGTPPAANQPTTRRSSSRRLNQTRLPFPMSWATVRIGTASRTPNTKTRTGRRTAAPPKPVTAASVDATNATTANKTLVPTVIDPVRTRSLQPNARCASTPSRAKRASPSHWLRASRLRLGLGPDRLFRQLVAVDETTVAHDERQLPNVVYVGERIGVEHEEIGELPHLQCPEVLEALRRN